MAKFISGRQQHLNVGISSSTENKTVLQVTGKVGIGTTDAATDALYVVGSSNITGNLDVGQELDVTGASYFGDNVIIDGELDTVGIATFQNYVNIQDRLSVSGVSTFTGVSTFASNVYVGNNLEVKANTLLNNTVVSGITTFQEDIYLGNEDRINLGATNDLQIYNDGNNSYIVDSGVGNLYIRGTSSINLQTSDGTENYARFNIDGATELYYNNDKKFETTGYGVSISNNGSSTATIGGPSNIIIDPAGIGDNTGSVRIKGDLYVDGTEFIVDSSRIELADFNVGIASTVSSNSMLDGAGIGIGSDNIRKTLTWNDSSSSLKSSDNFDLASGKSYKIGGTEVLNSSQLTVPNLNVSGVATISTLNSPTGTIDTLSGTNLSYTGVTTLSTLNSPTGTIDTLSGTNLSYTGVATIGVITGATYYGDISNTVENQWVLGSNGTSDYTFSGIGFIETQNDPILHLQRGKIYEFVNNSGGSHPFEIRLEKDGTSFNSGVLNNGASSGTIRFEVPIDAPDFLYYQCVNHSGMGNTIAIYSNYSLDLQVLGISTFNGEVDINGPLTLTGITTSQSTLFANQLSVVGVSTFASDLDINAAIDVDGHTELDELNVTGVSTFASNLDINASIDVDGHTELDELNVSGVSTFAANLVINAAVDIDGQTELDELNVAGVSTFAANLDINASIDVDGHTELDELQVTGISTFAANLDINASIDVDGHTELDELNVAGVSTFASDLDINAGIDVDGHTELDELRVAGVSTFTADLDINAAIDVDGHTELDELNVSGVSTFSSLVNLNGGADISGHLEIDNANISGVTTFTNTTNNTLGDVNTGAVQIDGGLGVEKNVTVGAGLSVGGDLSVNGQSLFVGIVTFQGGTIRLGDSDTDDVNVGGEFTSNLVPNASNSYDLGAVSKQWRNIYIDGLADIDDLNVTGVSTLGNTVVGGATTELVVNGSARITGILTVGSSSITIDGNNNSITIGTGVTINSSGINVAGGSGITGDFTGNLRNLGKTYYVATNGNDSYAGNNTNAPYATLAKALTVATSGDIILIGSGTFTEVFPLTIPQGVTVRGVSLRATFIQPTAGTKQNDGFLLNGDTTVEDLTIGNFFEPGYGFKFASGKKSTTRSPYIQRVTVLNKGSVTSVTDPYGFDTAHSPPTSYKAGRGVLIDGSVVDQTTLEPAMLFNECTFITPNNIALEMTNGARSEWVNCFTYFADKGIYAHDGNVGLASTGYVRIKTSGLTTTSSTPAANDELYYLESNYQSGTYSQVGTGLTITRVGHGLTVGDRIFADFTSGTATDGFYRVTEYVGVNTFSVTMAGSATTSGNVSYKEALGFGTVRSYDSSAGLSSITGKGEGLFELPTSRLGKTVTAYGDAALSTSQEKFGTASLLLDGTGDYARCEGGTDLTFPGNFTAECWVYPTSVTGSRHLFALGTETTGRYHLSLESGVVTGNFYGSASTTFGGSISINTWTHIALVRSGSTITAYVNGTALGTTETNSSTINNTGQLTIGADNSGSNTFVGYIDEVRISNTARYTGNFTTSTTPFVSDGSDKLLLHFDGVTGSVSFTDSSIPSQDIRWVRSDVGIATATKITLADYQQFGGDMRSIGSASVFGNTGVTADGPGSTLRLFSFNFGHVGSGKDFTQDISLVNQANEVVTSNNGRVYFSSIDQSGDFRVGDAFYVSQEDGTVNFGGQDFTLNSLSDLNVTDGTNTTTITPTNVNVGNILLSGNEITTTSGDLTINPSASSQTIVSGDLNVTGILTASVLTASALQTGNTSVAIDDTGSNGTIRLNTDGTEALRVSNTQKVGIGSQAPAYPLDVSGDINSSTAVKVNGVNVVEDAVGQALALAIALG